jgi:hypothetical protein
MMLVGIELPAGAESFLETARVLAEEYARMGFGEERLMRLFQDPFYAGAHRAYRALGEERVRAIVRELLRVWGAVRFRDLDSDPESGLITLPVLDREQEV